MPKLRAISKNGIPVPRPKRSLTDGIVLTKEAQHAIKHNGPSDKRLAEILTSNAESAMPTSREARWMAYWLLDNLGYKFVTED